MKSKRTSSPKSIPIMKVNPQPRVSHPARQKDLQINLIPRRFFVNTPGSLVLDQQSSGTSTPSVEPRLDPLSITIPPVNRPVFEFVSTEFKNGVLIPRPVDEKPPAKKRRRNGDRKTVLTIRKPVQNADDVHRDIWKQIFNFCDPKFLLEARFIDSVRRDILAHHQAIWRNSRLLHLGEDCPPCPSRLSEHQYVDLLAGRGCQIRTCRQHNTTTVSWAFLGRLCMDCLFHRTIRVDRLLPEHQHQLEAGTQLWEALPMVHYTSNRHGSPRRVNEQATDWVWQRGTYLVMKADYDKLESEYLEKKDGFLPDSEILQWWQEKKRQTIWHMDEVVKISKWVVQNRWSQTSVSSERDRFFRQKAASLDPPMSGDELRCMAAYHKALRSNNPPSEMAWNILLEKMQPHREVAARMAEVQQEMGDSYTNWNHPPEPIAIDRELREHRHPRNRVPKVFVAEQFFVIELGRREYERCVENGVSDHNLVLTCLINVWEAYQDLSPSDRPQGISYDGVKGLYSLSMDDARMIIEEVIEPDMPAGSQKRSRVLSSFKCPGCRTDYQREMGFVDCLKHLYSKHSTVVGDEGEFWRLFKPYDSPFRGFPFYSTAWMRCLPLLPSYCDARLMPPWTPDMEMDFLYDETPSSNSAFDRRFAQWKGQEAPDFLDAFAHVMESMKQVTLKPQFIAKIALQYARDLSTRFSTPIPSLEDFMARVATIQQWSSTLRLKFRCETCVNDESEVARARPVKFEVSIEQLYQHWLSKHGDEQLDWTTQMMRLPNDGELTDEMERVDEKLKRDKEKIVGFVQEDMVKKRPNPKAGVILGMRFAGEVFDELFPVVE